MGQNEALLARLLVMLSGDPKPPQPASPSLAQMQDYLYEHLYMPTDLSRIAEHFGVAKSTLCRKVKNHFGRTVLQMHEELKIRWACLLLKQCGQNVTSVARRLGYRDPCYFSRVFKRHLGISPLHWRQMQRDR